MGAPIPLRDDYDAATLRRLAKESEDANQTRRLLALASIYDGGSRSSAVKLDIPDNITLLPLPSRSQELNPVENIWQFLREN